MDDDATELYNREMEKLERQQRNLRDKYSTLEQSINQEDYNRILKGQTDLKYSSRPKEPLKQFITRIKMYAEEAQQKNFKIHVIIGSHGRPWYQHKNPMGCFCCEDINMISYLIATLDKLDHQTPKQIL